jgi:hypothetical protein
VSLFAVKQEWIYVASHAYTNHSNGTAPWQHSRRMLCWVLCDSKFAVVSLHWEVWAACRCFFWPMEAGGALALTTILFVSTLEVVGGLPLLFLRHGSGRSSSAAIHSLRLHSNGTAPWQNSRRMFCRVLCDSKFVVPSLHWELWATMRFMYSWPFRVPALVRVCPPREWWTFSHTFLHAYVSAESWLQKKETLFCHICKLAGKFCRSQRNQQDRWRRNWSSSVKFICSRIKKRRKPRVKIVTLQLCWVWKSR